MAEKIIIHEPTKSEFKRMAAQMDYVPVVRCKDCKWAEPDIFVDKYWCTRSSDCFEMQSVDFCSYGERRTDE